MNKTEKELENVIVEKKGGARFSDGYWYFFDTEVGEVAVHGSAWTGKERVYINAEIVSEKICLGFKSRHIFQVDESTYQILLSVKKFMRGTVECILLRDGHVVGQKEYSFFSQKIKFWQLLIGLLGCFGGGFAVGVIVAAFSS